LFLAFQVDGQINCGGITTGGAMSLNSSIIPGQHENTWVFGVVRSRIGFANSKPWKIEKEAINWLSLTLSQEEISGWSCSLSG
jgi:hypothetical protein